MDVDFRKYFFWLFVFVGVFIYVSKNYDGDDVLAWAKKNPKPVARRVEYYVGTMRYMKGDYAHAAAAFDQVLQSQTTGYYGEESLYFKSRAYYQQKRWNHAREALNTYIKRFPKGKHATEAEKRYEQIKFR